MLRAEPTMSKEKGEVYYITPTGKKLRTRHEIMNHLHDDLTINNFTLVKEGELFSSLFCLGKDVQVNLFQRSVHLPMMKSFGQRNTTTIHVDRISIL